MNNCFSSMGPADDKPHEECGVFGAYDPAGNDVAPAIYYGLFALQHRGQESCGIAVGDTLGPRRILLHKDMGLVSEVFNEERLQKLGGNIGVGHVRYSTAGDSSPQNAQPLVLNYIKGTLCIAHNGNLVNAVELRRELELSGSIFQTSADTEVIAYHIARERLNAKSAEEAVASAMQKISGAYSLIVMSPRKLIGVRDPMGFRPLCIGKRDSTYFLASESCALDAVGAEFVRDVAPGEIVTITETGIFSEFPREKATTAHCIFEYIYFARPDSIIDGIGVYESRVRAGRELARQHPVEADLVVGVPESGNDAALGFSLESGIPYGKAFVKNNYVGRTFIKPTQLERESSVRIKLNALKKVVCGKRIVMIDDSIVRGTTCAQIVSLLREAGATEVHVRISSPPFKHPCYFGTDIPTGGQLIANRHNEQEICTLIGADSLGYLSVKSLSEIIQGRLSCCDACFSGKYPVARPKH
ncbi:amidophosphoribosyltransferase [Fumia xinanensis]